MPKRRIAYEFRPSRRDIDSIAFDLDVQVRELTDKMIQDWVTQVLCEELSEIRHERLK